MEKKRRNEDDPHKAGTSGKLKLSRRVMESEENDEEDALQEETATSGGQKGLIVSDIEDDDLDDLDEERQSVWKCKLCNNKEFKTKKTLRNHELVKHMNTEKFVCPDCSKELASKRSLTTHMITHKKGEFPCDEVDCEYVGPTSTALTKHKSLHKIGDLKFKCLSCDCAYSTALQLRNHTNSAVHPEVLRFKVNTKQAVLVGSQNPDSQPLSDVGSQDKEKKTYRLESTARNVMSKDAVAVLVMNAWDEDKKQIKTALTTKFKTNNFNYTRMKSNSYPKNPALQHLTHDPSSFYITGEDSEKSANLCLSIIKITQLLLDMKFKFNQLIRMQNLSISNWNADFFLKFLSSNGFKVIMESKEDYVQRKGNEENFSMYYRDRNWIGKAPEETDGHIYAAFFKFLGELYLYLGINESVNSSDETLARVHLVSHEHDRTALGEFIREQKKKHPDKPIEVQARRLVHCARSTTGRKLESACIMAAVFGSDQEIFLDDDHKGKFRLLNKRMDIEEFTDPFLQATRYVTYVLFKKRLNISHEGEYTPHVLTTTVDECFENVIRMQ